MPGWLRAAFAPLLLVVGCGPLLGLDDDARLVEESDPLDGCGSCDDGDPCTVDFCDASGTCRHEAAGDGLAPVQKAGDCRVSWCVDGRLESRIDDTDVPESDRGCSVASCRDGSPVQVPNALGTSCGRGVCDGAGSCVECLTDDQCGQYQTCGGGGTPNVCGCVALTCGTAGMTCGSVPDGCGGTLSCDGSFNGYETDVDCGGLVSSCARRCEIGRSCEHASDCTSGFCSGGLCRDPWGAILGGAGTERVGGVAVGPDGSVVLVGTHTSSAMIGELELEQPASGEGIYLVKLSPEGAPLWAKSLGAGDATASGVAIDGSGNIVLAGAMRGELNVIDPVVLDHPRGFVLKLDTNGNALWITWLGDSTAYADGATNEPTALALDDEDRILIAGTYSGSLLAGSPGNPGGAQASGNGDAFVARLDPAGNVQLVEAFLGDGTQRPTSLSSRPGAILLAGDFTGSVDFGGGDLVSEGSADIFVLVVDDSGEHRLSLRFGDALQQHLAAARFDPQGNLVLAGETSGSIDFGDGPPLTPKGAEDAFVAKLDEEGNHLWSRLFGNPGRQHIAAMQVASDGDIYAVGSFQGILEIGPKLLVSGGSYDVLAFGLDPSGGVIFAGGYGAALSQYGRALAVTPYGGVVLAGELTGTIDFGQGPLAASGAQDVFVASLAP